VICLGLLTSNHLLLLGIFQANPQEEVFAVAYTAEISRKNPGCFIFLIDQSSSMSDPIGGSPKQKAEFVSDALNRLIQNILIKCAKPEGIRDHFHLGVIGYGARVGWAFSGLLAGKGLAPISEVANSPARIDERTKKVDDGAGGLVDQNIKFPVWFDPVANNGTPMCNALELAFNAAQDWIRDHGDSFPPIIMNITDGEGNDGDPRQNAAKIRSLTCKDGNVLLLNLHVSTHEGAAIEFPDTDVALPSDYAKQLFEMSSVLPEYMRKAAAQEQYKVTDQSRGYVFNADMAALINFLDIGTRPSNLR
jgi:hypothetical protein